MWSECVRIVRGGWFAAMAAVLGACSGGNDLAAARTRAEQANAEMARAQSLQAQGDVMLAKDAAAAAQGLFLDARDLFLSAKADESADVDVLVEFAEIAESLEDNDLAGDAYARAASIEAGRGDWWYAAARNYLEAEGRYLGLVIPSLDQAAAVSTDSPHAVLASDLDAVRGDVFLAQGNLDAAQRHFGASLAVDPDHARARIGMAGVSLRLGDAVSAAKYADSFAQPTPAQALMLELTLRRAYLDVVKEREQLPANAESLRALAKICLRLGFVREAIAAIEGAVRLDDRDVFSWNLLGSLSAQSGNVARAREAFTKSLELNPNQPRTQEALGQLGGSTN